MNVIALFCVLALSTSPGIGASTVPTQTVTGPIPTPEIGASWDWEPGPVAWSLDETMPDLLTNLNTVIGVAYYWVVSTWLDGGLLDYWLLYQVAVALFGRFLGNILGRGGFSVAGRMAAQGYTPPPQPKDDNT